MFCFSIFLFVRWRWRCVRGGKFVYQIGWTALMCAAERGYIDCIRLLIDAGAETETKCNVRIGC
jgi:hypothetical protein